MRFVKFVVTKMSKSPKNTFISEVRHILTVIMTFSNLLQTINVDLVKTFNLANYTQHKDSFYNE